MRPDPTPIGRRQLRDRLAGMSDEERARATEAIRQRMPRGLNENYARELLELHTLGVDGGYTQQDIVEVAKAFTGWTIRGPRQGGGFWFDERRHVKGTKHVLGTSIDRGGERDGEAVLDLLARHPSTATFIATKLARRFVADKPPPALVERAAETFTKTHGDLREVTRTILTSPEFLAAEARRAKVKTPFEFVASALRASGADITGGLPLAPPAARARHAALLRAAADRLRRPRRRVGQYRRAPRAHELRARAGGQPHCRRPHRSRRRSPAAAAWTRRANALVRTWLSNEASESTRATLAKATDVTQVAALTLGSPEFQRR